MAGIWSIGVIAYAAEKGNVMHGIDIYSLGGIFLWLSSEFAWQRRRN
jgi:hypothetical protein